MINGMQSEQLVDKFTDNISMTNMIIPFNFKHVNYHYVNGVSKKLENFLVRFYNKMLKIKKTLYFHNMRLLLLLLF